MEKTHGGTFKSKTYNSLTFCQKLRNFKYNNGNIMKTSVAGDSFEKANQLIMANSNSKKNYIKTKKRAYFCSLAAGRKKTKSFKMY